jgi:hypothetical protein
LKKQAQAPLAGVHYDSNRCMGGSFRTGNLGGRLLSGDMGLGRGVSCAKRALLFRLRPAHRATDGQYMSQRELCSFHVSLFNIARWRNGQFCSLFEIEGMDIEGMDVEGIGLGQSPSRAELH